MDDTLPEAPRKGRGAVSNPTGRFERHSRSAVDDGWAIEDDLPPLATTVIDEACRGVVSRNRSPDISFDQSLNPYRGCEHGCIYCYARPTHAYHGLSPGLDFETVLFAKPDAPALLERELRRPGYRCRPLMVGANTDPYQPVERRRRITRGVLEVLSAFNHPVCIATKSALVVRDLDILADMASRRLVKVGFSLTTLDPVLARTLEPRAAAPHRRLDAMRRLSEAGVPTGVMVAPVIPALTDSELERILSAAAEAGARAATYILLRLPLELKDLFSEWLRAHAPHRAERVLGRLREARDGHLYVAEFASRMRGTGHHADLLAERFRLACRRLGLDEHRDGGYGLDATRFAPPPRPGDQLRLL